MIDMCTFRKLKANELQCKTTDTKFKGSATILIFKDARVDMKVLDETVTPMRWQKDYKEIDGKVYCGVAIKSEDTGEWIWKWDCGTEGNFEAEKSEASDAFKRACFNWGLGRELYDTPKIRIKCPDDYYYNDRLTMTFTVQKIEWDGDILMELVIVDRFGKKVYDYTEKTTDVQKPEQSTDNLKALKAFCASQKAVDGTNKEELLRFFKFYEPKCAEWSKYKVDWSDKWNNWHSDAKKRTS